VAVATEAVAPVPGATQLTAPTATLAPNALAQLKFTATQMVRVDRAVTGAKAGVVGTMSLLTQDGARNPPVDKASVGVVLEVVAMAGETGKSMLQLAAVSAIEAFSP